MPFCINLQKMSSTNVLIIIENGECVPCLGDAFNVSPLTDGVLSPHELSATTLPVYEKQSKFN